MKKWYLQLFADDPTPEEDPAETEVVQEEKPKDEKKEPKKEPKYTDEDVDRIINRKFAEWEKKQQAKVDEAAKLADMTATEKEKYRADQLEKELEELKKKDTLSEMSKTARRILADEEINIPDELLGNLVTTDAEQTKEAVQAFAKLFKGAVQAAVTDKLKGAPPKRGGKPSMTKEQILAVKNPSERQKLIAEHLELFE